VCRFAGLIAPRGSVLDLACGSGRHARYLAALGCEVVAVDRDAEALATLRGQRGIDPRYAELEADPWPFAGRRFDGIIVTNYLHRPLWPSLIAALAANGVLIYETFMVGNEAFGKPANPDYLLRPHELLEVFLPDLSVVAFEQGEITTPRPAVVQRLCAFRGTGVIQLRSEIHDQGDHAAVSQT
jgi:SAM-dependent methyltransferase